MIKKLRNKSYAPQKGACSKVGARGGEKFILCIKLLYPTSLE
jgi:hypothetical protein